MTNPKPLFAIIDGNAIIHRAYHALPPLTTKDGTMVNAVYGFTSMLLKVITEIKPTHLVVSFDVAGGTFRDDVYEDYKATRTKSDQDLYDQIPLIYDVVEAFGVPIFTKEGFEADDVIGTVVKKLNDKYKDLQSVIVTGDMDILQLVNERTTVFSLRKGMSDVVRYDAEKVTERYGFGPERVIDYKALRGDTSDNIPGVKGIGEKTAVQLLTNIGTLDDIYKAVKKDDERIKPRYLKLLKEYEKDAYMSYDLATIRTDVKGVNVNLDECEWGGFDYGAIRETFQKFEFLSLLKRVPGYTNHVSEDASEKDGVEEKIESEAVEGIAELKLKGDVMVYAEEDAGKLVALHLKANKKHFALKAPEENVESWASGLVQKLYETKGVTLIGHDLKHILRYAHDCRPNVQVNLFDVMVASYLLSTGERSHDLDAVLQREFADHGKSKEEKPTTVLSRLSKLHTHYTKELKEETMYKLFIEVEMPLIPVLSEMECEGVELDVKFFEKMSKDVHKSIDSLTKKIHNAAGREFNVSSSVQLRRVLFEEMNLPTENIKKGKTGYSTAASELEKLRGKHSIIKYIEEYREVTKLQNTYIDVLPTLVDPKTNRVHTTFNQTIAATGRLSSVNPNLQNIPTRTELGRKIRNGFVAKEGCVLMAADYSQIELRVAAHLSKDKELIRIFKEGEDVHTATAATIHRIPIKDVTKQIRSTAKEVNFGVLYGMGAFGLASRTGLTIPEATEFIESYFAAFSGVKAYIDTLLKNAKENGYVETLFGRRRYVPELASSNFQLRAAGERMAVNMPMQGTVADMVKVAMINVRKELENYPDVAMLLQVHDEIILEVPEKHVKKLSKTIETIMQDVIKLEVPVVVNVHTGKSWGDL